MSKRIHGVDVNLNAFKGVKNIKELKKEPGKIFGHLPEEEEGAAYDELAAALGIAKPTDQSTLAPTSEEENGAKDEHAASTIR